MPRSEVITRPIGGLWTLTILTVVFTVTIILSAVYMLMDLVWTLLFDQDFPVGESIPRYHSGVYVWASRNWLWVTTGEGSFDLIPGYEPDEVFQS